MTPEEKAARVLAGIERTDVNRYGEQVKADDGVYVEYDDAIAAIAAISSLIDPPPVAKAEWASLANAVTKMSDYPQGCGFHISSGVADRAKAKLTQIEAAGYPPPLLLPTDDTDLTLTWRVGPWSLWYVISDGEEAYWDVSFSTLRAKEQNKTVTRKSESHE